MVSERPLEITGQSTATPQKFVHAGLDVGALDILAPFTSRPILSLSSSVVMNMAVIVLSPSGAGRAKLAVCERRTVPSYQPANTLPFAAVALSVTGFPAAAWPYLGVTATVPEAVESG